jgi:two-component system, OmpR family, sensor histidine kinase MtrB
MNRHRAPSRRHRLPLRLRVAATFAVLGLAATTVVSAATYAVSRTYLLDQRVTLATRQAFLNARLAKNLLRSDEPNPEELVTTVVGESGTQALLRFAGTWYSSSVALDPAELPTSLQDTTSDGAVARQLISRNNVPLLVIGVPLGTVDATYYEIVPLAQLQRTLNVLATSLIGASVLTTLAAAGVGFYVTRRLLRPLQRMSDVAVDIAEGDLEGRLDAEGDDDLEPLVDSFNHMVGALHVRLGREARFAADVSHELRTPLTALSTAVEVVKARSHDLPLRTRAAVEVLDTQVSYFERLVLDLLEMSRLDAGAEKVSAEEVDLASYLSNLSASLGGQAVECEGSGPWHVDIDKRRVGRIVSNLIENADRYAGGVVRLALRRSGDRVVIIVEDAGPGIPPGDREKVFERFWRGASARQQTSKGSGLGLALAAEHVRLLGGSITVDDRPGGGTRFLVELPVSGEVVIEEVPA